VKREENELLRRLLGDRRLLALGVEVGERPYVGQVPYAFWAERGSLLIHVSALARHTKGLREGASVSVLISAGEEGGDPFQVPRVTLEVSARRLESPGEGHEEARRVYLDKLPSGGRHFQLGDFSLYELVITGGRFVAGFGRTYNLTAESLSSL